MYDSLSILLHIIGVVALVGVGAGWSMVPERLADHNGWGAALAVWGAVSCATVAAVALWAGPWLISK